MQIQQTSIDSEKIITDGLNSTRRDLLDLSKRNRLLNFKHSGSKILRFVDELPNCIYEKLISSADENKKGLLISPVPLPKRNEYPEVEANILKKIDVKSHAEKLGINKEYEMPTTSIPEGEHNKEDKLQTLLYPEDMDKAIRRIQSEARTAIEESGVNMLFLCLGYLRWSDHDDSKLFNYAPLIMIPIEIERDKVDTKTGFTKFRLKYTGEDIFDNICLREKLAQMSIELPSFEDFRMPEEYFATLTSQLADIRPDWGIHRFVTACFLSFGKMLMYLDLDPANWSDKDGIAEAAHIYDIFAGNHSGGDPIASEFDIDSDNNFPHISQVMDADSSQHSAILDVLAGRNIVIEGPPGTGKSQTITNLIAACISEGKTVLFVAEKLAALQVVRKRLDSIGLGDFCLELHSHKSQRKAMLADLKKRLEMSTNTYRSAGENAEERFYELNSKKTKLIEYTKAINTPFAKTGMTPHEIFWKTEVLHKECRHPYKPEAFTAPKDLECTSMIALRERLDALKNLSDNLRNYFGGNSHHQGHYWQGLGLVGPVEYTRQQDLISLLRNLHSAAKQAKVSLERLQQYSLDASALKTYKLEILKEDDFTHSPYFTLPDINNACDEINTYINLLNSYQNTINRVNSSLHKNNLEPSQVENLDENIIHHSTFPRNLSFEEAQKISDRVIPALAAFKNGQPIFREAATYLGLSEHIDSISAIQAIVSVSAYCSSIEVETLSHINPVIEQSISNTTTNKLLDEIISLKKEQKKFKEKFNFNNLPSDERLLEISSTLSKTTLFSSLSKEWRTARDEYKIAAKNDELSNPKSSAQKISEFLSFNIRLKCLNDNMDYHRLLPGIFKGIDTDVDSLSKAINFYDSLCAVISTIPDFGYTLHDRLRVLESKHYEWLASNHDSCAKALQGLTSLVEIRFSFDKSSTDSGITSLINSIAKYTKELEKIKINLNSLKIPSDLSLKKLRQTAKEFDEFQKARQNLQSNKLSSEFNFSTKIEAIPEQIDILQSIQRTIKKAKKILPQTALQHVLCREGLENFHEITTNLDHVSFYQEVIKKLNTLLPNTKTLKEFWNYEGIDENEQITAIISKLDKLDKETDTFTSWCEVLNSYAELKNLGLDTIVSSFAKSTDPEVPFSDYGPLYHFLVYHTLSNEVLRKNPVLGSFSRVTHENIRSSFKEIDIELQKLNAQKLIHKISQKPIPEGHGGRSPKEFTNAKLIRHEISKQKAHIPIRQLVTRAYDTLVAIKPCFMMGPLSVAQYVPPRRAKFDILIMDEASQIKPEDAIGVLARAKQVVVVGDSNQLPPTGFFDTLGSDDNSDDETTIENSKSILDVCKPVFQPLRRLRWHYRSKHQSLISFSNNHFYDKDLIIFPSPTEHSDTKGVKHVYVSNGIYTNQSNPIEAQRVVKEIIEMIEQNPNLSYGVVTLNAKQKTVIEDEIERARKDNPLFDSYINNSDKKNEEFFVKNLETVQGDERDVIFISTTFGQDEEGTFRQHFGPINRKDGWRRLNVLFTRAKQHVRIFSSFLPDRIKIDDTKEQRGLRALKDYLNYAITGIDNHSYLTHQEPDSDFERAVGNFLAGKGYDVVYQLGVAGYRIDIVVRHPQCPTDYLLAIECDGATYHSARSARDRDRLREENLRKLGWSHIHRIWSTDWFRRRNQEEDRLLHAVESAVNEKVKIA